MLAKENFTEERIRSLQESSRRDPILLERTIYAFGLLEALRIVGLPFIFKGGTSLMLLLPHPRRLSTDIDIVVPPDTNVEQYIQAASEVFPFKSLEEDIRAGHNRMMKSHYKFTYDSPIRGSDFYILLDILYENNHYAEVVEKEIRNELLLTEPEYLTVEIPSIAAMLGDKLTAFAPHTTGIRLDDQHKRVMEIWYKCMMSHRLRMNWIILKLRVTHTERS